MTCDWVVSRINESCHLRVGHVTNERVLWLIHTWHNSFGIHSYVTWLIRDSFICDMTHSWLIHVWHALWCGSFICDMTHSWLIRDSFVTHSYVTCPMMRLDWLWSSNVMSRINKIVTLYPFSHVALPRHSLSLLSLLIASLPILSRLTPSSLSLVTRHFPSSSSI